MAGQLGTTADAVGSAVVSATASSRFVAPSYWRDPKSGVSYQVQVQVPQPKMTSLGDIGNIPVRSTTGAQPLVNQLADLRTSTVPGELDRQNGQWMLSFRRTSAVVISVARTRRSTKQLKMPARLPAA